MGSQLDIFLSYAHEDEALKRELEKHLAILQQKDLIIVWHDRLIGAGTEWEQAIHTHLNTSHIILLLISPDFLASRYCYGVEMQYALQRHQRGEVKVVPIILRPTYWQIDPLDKLQALPKDAEPVTLWANQDAAFLNIVQGMLNVIHELRGETSGASSTIFPKKVAHASHAIYLMKIIEEYGRTDQREEELSIEREIDQFSDGTRKITAWLAAEGDVTYVVDSVTIGHRSSTLTLLAAGYTSGAVHLDAHYSFPIIANATKTYALNPALVLSHEDRQEVAFSLKLIPPKGGVRFHDHTDFRLHYHTFDGTQGKLSLAPPPEKGIILSQLLKADVEINGLIISPNGCQRGIDEYGDRGQIREVFSYTPLKIPYPTFFHDFLSSGRRNSSAIPLPIFSLTQERQVLNRAIEEKGIVPQILKSLNEVKNDQEPRKDLLFDLCAGLPHLACEHALIEMSHTAQYPISLVRDTLSALAIRHMLQPSDALANFVLTITEVYRKNFDEVRNHKSFFRCEGPDVFVALAYHRKGKWVQALITVHAFSWLVSDSDAVDLLLSMQDTLTSEECQIADGFVWEQFVQILQLDMSEEEIYYAPLRNVVKYLLWANYPSAEIRQKLLEMKNIICGAGRYAQSNKNTLKRLIRFVRFIQLVLAEQDEPLPIQRTLTGRNGTEKSRDFYYNLGKFAQQHEEWKQAEQYYQQALEIYQQSKHSFMQAGCYYRLGKLAIEQEEWKQHEEWKQAEQYCQQALEIYQQSKHSFMQTSTFHLLGRLAEKQGKWKQAEQYYQQVLKSLIDSNSRSRQIHIYDHLVKVAEAQERWSQAEQYYKGVLHLYRQSNDRSKQSDIYRQLGIAAQKQRHWIPAVQYYQQALQIYQETNDRPMQVDMYDHLGKVALKQRQWAQACDCFMQVLAISREDGDEYNSNNALRNLADLWRINHDTSIVTAVVPLLNGFPEEVEEQFREFLSESLNDADL